MKLRVSQQQSEVAIWLDVATRAGFKLREIVELYRADRRDADLMLMLTLTRRRPRPRSRLH